MAEFNRAISELEKQKDEPPMEENIVVHSVSVEKTAAPKYKQQQDDLNESQQSIGKGFPSKKK